MALYFQTALVPGAGSAEVSRYPGDGVEGQEAKRAGPAVHGWLMVES